LDEAIALGGRIGGAAFGATCAWGTFLLQVPIGVSYVFVPPIIRWAIGNPIPQNSEGEWIQDGKETIKRKKWRETTFLYTTVVFSFL